MAVGGQPTPRPPIPPRKTQYPLYRRLGGPQGRSGRVENLVPTGIRSRTVQPVVSRYTDGATRSVLLLLIIVIILQLHRCYKTFRTVTIGEKLPRLLQCISDVTKATLYFAFLYEMRRPELSNLSKQSFRKAK